LYLSCSNIVLWNNVLYCCSQPLYNNNNNNNNIQNMILVDNKLKSGGLYEKHVVANWNLWNHLSICL